MFGFLPAYCGVTAFINAHVSIYHNFAPHNFLASQNPKYIHTYIANKCQYVY